MLEIGTMLSGRYEVLKRVGSGGMADVYMAKDHKLNRNVAVKVLKSEYVEDEKFLKKFETEAQAVARLSHPNIVNVYDVGIEDGINYIVMELAEGMTLKEYIRRKGYLSPKETVEISLQIASAISHAHKNHIIHRDIKPQNILVSEIGNVKVTDFGIAKATSSNTVTSTATAMGSVHYISPEQAKGRFCDEKSDIYSLGITMYEMVTGHVPFDHENGVTIALMHLQNEITPPSQVRDGIPDSLEKIILKCTMKKPEDRYQTADELIADLKLVFEDTSGEYVGIVPTIDDSPTIMIDQNELTQRIQTNDDTQPVEDSDSNAYLEEDDEEEETGMNSKIEKLVIVLAAVVGAIIGLMTMKLDLSDGFDKKKMIKFNIAQIVAHLVAWAVVAPVLDIVIYSEPVEKLFAQGLMASIANIITTGVVGTLLLFAYSKTLVKKGSLSKED